MTEQPAERPVNGEQKVVHRLEDLESVTPEEFMQTLIDRKIVEEALHIEAFIGEVFNITTAEHNEGKRWMNEGGSMDALPPAMQRVARGPIIDARYEELVHKYGMTENEFRQSILNKLQAAATARAWREAGR